MGRWEAGGAVTRSDIPSDKNVPLWELFLRLSMLYHPDFQEEPGPHLGLGSTAGVRVYLFDFVSLLLVF